MDTPPPPSPQPPPPPPPQPKVAISARVFSESKAIGDWGKVYDKSVNLRRIVDWALEKAAARAQQGLIFKGVESCVSEDALDRRGRELDNDDLSDITVADLHNHFGRFLKVFCDLDSSEAGAPATPLPSATEELMSSQRRAPRALPALPLGSRYDHRLFRALVSNLERDHLSFPVLDAQVSGKRLLKGLSEVLQYLLPFDDADESALRLAGRVHLVVPARFTTKVCNSRLTLFACAAPVFRLACAPSLTPSLVCLSVAGAQ